MAEWSRRAGLIGLAVIFIGLAAVCGAIRAHSAGWEPAADLGIVFAPETLRFDALRPDGPAERAGLKRHDRLLAIDDTPVKTRLEVHDAVRRSAPGDTMRLTVNLAVFNEPRTVAVVLDANKGLARNGLLRGFPLLLIALTGVVLVLRSDRLEAWLMALVTTGAVATTPLLAFLERVPPDARGFAVAFQVLFAALGPAALYYLLSVFPEPSELDGLDPRVKSVGLLASAAVAVPFAVWAAATRGTALHGGALPVAGRWLIGIAWTAAVLAGGFSLWRCAVESRSNDARLRAEIVGVAALAGLLPVGLLTGIAAVRGQAFGDLPSWVRAGALSLLVVPPLGLGYAIAARQALPLETLLKRCARDIVDRLLFWQSWATRRGLDELPAELSTASTRSEVVALLERELTRVYRPSSVAIYVATGNESLKVECGEVPREMEELRLDEPLPGVGATPIGALDRAIRIGPDCAAPLVGSDATVLGFVVLCARDSDEPFSAAEMDGLASVATHAGVALERLAPGLSASVSREPST